MFYAANVTEDKMYIALMSKLFMLYLFLKRIFSLGKQFFLVNKNSTITIQVKISVQVLGISFAQLITYDRTQIEHHLHLLVLQFMSSYSPFLLHFL